MNFLCFGTNFIITDPYYIPPLEFLTLCHLHNLPCTWDVFLHAVVCYYFETKGCLLHIKMFLTLLYRRIVRSSLFFSNESILMCSEISSLKIYCEEFRKVNIVFSFLNKGLNSLSCLSR